MSDQYVGEIRMFTAAGGAKAPAGWSFCDGTVLPISGNEALFSLLGNLYGGDGRNNFALPDLRGRLPIHFGTAPASGITYNRGSAGGTEQVTLATNQLPSHTHEVNVVSGAGAATTPNPGNTTFPATSTVNFYATVTSASLTSIVNMNSAAVTSSGGTDAHGNIMPYLTIAFIIAREGLYPQAF